MGKAPGETGMAGSSRRMVGTNAWRVMGSKGSHFLFLFFPYIERERDSSVLNPLWKDLVEKELTKLLER